MRTKKYEKEKVFNIDTIKFADFDIFVRSSEF